MRFEVVTLFESFFETARVGLLDKAVQQGLISLETIDPRAFATDKHRSVDDAPYGGGAGMLLKPEPMIAALNALDARRGGVRSHRILLSPQGKVFEQADAARLAALGSITLIAGRYEGFDDRIVEHVDEELSMGDYVLFGGETAALAIIEAVSRLIDGVLGNEQSAPTDSHQQGLLSHPQYTRPPVFERQSVPDVLLSGDHGAIERWRHEQAVRRTFERRPDLLAKRPWSSVGAVYCALVHHPVRDRAGDTVTTSVTNMDVHDIARTARTYGMKRYFVVTPLDAQRPIVEKILEHWSEDGAGTKRPAERHEALQRTAIAASIDDGRSTRSRKPNARRPPSGRPRRATPGETSPPFSMLAPV
ncbi:MAG: tRNA (guanosine(37)-N1)-methyltransferase TrmD [Polyangiales bacterium]